MSQPIYTLLQNLIPQLENQPIPEESNFYNFYDWINESQTFFHYIELKEYYDNGITDNFYFKQLKVNTTQLEQEIESAISDLFEQFAEEDDVSFENQTDIMEQTEEIIFDRINKVAKQYSLSLLVIQRENPYWTLVPTQDEVKLNQIVDAFHEAFQDEGGDLNMVIY